MTPLELLRAFARYKTHAGYTWGAVMADGAIMCERCVRENYRAVYSETKKGDSARTNIDWQCIGLTNSGETEDDETIMCVHCGRILWGAYAMSDKPKAPDLEPHCGSWVIVQRITRDAVREVWNRATADRIAAEESEHFEVLTAAQWLAEFNRTHR